MHCWFFLLLCLSPGAALAKNIDDSDNGTAYIFTFTKLETNVDIHELLVRAEKHDLPIRMLFESDTKIDFRISQCETVIFKTAFPMNHTDVYFQGDWIPHLRNLSNETCGFSERKPFQFIVPSNLTNYARITFRLEKPPLQSKFKVDWHAPHQIDQDASALEVYTSVLNTTALRDLCKEPVNLALQLKANLSNPCDLSMGKCNLMPDNAAFNIQHAEFWHMTKSWLKIAQLFSQLSCSDRYSIQTFLQCSEKTNGSITWQLLKKEPKEMGPRTFTTTFLRVLETVLNYFLVLVVIAWIIHCCRTFDVGPYFPCEEHRLELTIREKAEAEKKKAGKGGK